METGKFKNSKGNNISITIILLHLDQILIELVVEKKELIAMQWMLGTVPP